MDLVQSAASNPAADFSSALLQTDTHKFSDALGNQAVQDKPAVFLSNGQKIRAGESLTINGREMHGGIVDNQSGRLAVFVMDPDQKSAQMPPIDYKAIDPKTLNFESDGKKYHLTVDRAHGHYAAVDEPVISKPTPSSNQKPDAIIGGVLLGALGAGGLLGATAIAGGGSGSAAIAGAAGSGIAVGGGVAAGFGVANASTSTTTPITQTTTQPPELPKIDETLLQGGQNPAMFPAAQYAQAIESIREILTTTQDTLMSQNLYLTQTIEPRVTELEMAGQSWSQDAKAEYVFDIKTDLQRATREVTEKLNALAPKYTQNRQIVERVNQANPQGIPLVSAETMQKVTANAKMSDEIRTLRSANVALRSALLARLSNIA